jgi:hypothetical protein
LLCELWHCLDEEWHGFLVIEQAIQIVLKCNVTYRCEFWSHEEKIGRVIAVALAAHHTPKLKSYNGISCTNVLTCYFLQNNPVFLRVHV